MHQPADRHTALGWLQVLPLVAIGVLAVALWRPAPDPAPSPEQEAKIADLAQLLGSRVARVEEIDNRLRSFGPFPPDANASRALAEALVRCGTIWLDESQRTQLARHVYGITVVGDDRATTIPAALLGIQQVAAAAGPACGPGAIERIVRAAREVASTDPHPRRDWW